MQIVIRVAPRVDRHAAGGESVPRFELLPRREAGFSLALALSLALHVAGALVAPGAMELLGGWRWPAVDWRQAEIRPARAMPLLVRAPQVERMARLRFQPVKPQAMQAEGRKSGPPGAQPAAGPPAAVVKSVEETASAILLQPGREQARPDQAVALRSLSVWSGPNRPRGAAPIVPGAVEPVPAKVSASLQLSLDAPVPEPVRAAVAAPKLPESGAARKPRLFVMPSGASPLRSAPPQLEEPAVATAGAAPGDPAAIMILSPLRPRGGEILTIPPGNLVILGSGTGAKAAPDNPAGKAPVENRAGPRQAEAADAAARQSVAAKGELEAQAKPELRVARSGAAGAGAESPASPVKPAAGDGTGGTAGDGKTPAAGGAAAGRAAGATRTIHTPSGEILVRVDADGSVILNYPENGTFDLVAVDAVLPQALGDLSSVLSGRPVHTAYLNVGEPVEWVLHYCLPGHNGGARQRYGVVALDAPRPLKAPYVLEAFLPPEPLWRWSGYQAFHAMLTAAGRLEEVRILRAGSAGAALLEALRRWTFRPAFLGAAPASVEVLLVVPPLRAGQR